MEEQPDHDAAREQWEQRQAAVRRMQNIGLAVLAVGVLVPAYVALTPHH